MDALEKGRQQLLRRRKLLHILGFVVGALVGAFVVFQIFFLYRVLPHGGL